MGLTVYRIKHRVSDPYGDSHSIVTEFISKAAADAFAHDLSTQDEVTSVTTTEEEIRQLLIKYNPARRGPFYHFDPEGAVNIGDMPVDIYPSGHYTCYTTPELEDKARAALERMKEELAQQSDGYYSQPWV